MRQAPSVVLDERGLGRTSALAVDTRHEPRMWARDPGGAPISDSDMDYQFGAPANSTMMQAMADEDRTSARRMRQMASDPMLVDNSLGATLRQSHMASHGGRVGAGPGPGAGEASRCWAGEKSSHIRPRDAQQHHHQHHDALPHSRARVLDHDAPSLRLKEGQVPEMVEEELRGCALTMEHIADLVQFVSAIPDPKSNA